MSVEDTTFALTAATNIIDDIFKMNEIQVKVQKEDGFRVVNLEEILVIWSVNSCFKC